MSVPQKPPLDSFSARQRGLIYALDLPATGAATENHEPDLAVTFHELSAVDAGAVAAAMEQPRDAVSQRLSQHRRCFVARRGDAVASYCWISQQAEQVGEMESVLDLHPGEAYVWNCATLPPYRRQGLYTALLAFIVNQLAGEDLTRIWIGADLENVPSHRAFHTVGFVPAADLRFFRVWRLFGYLTTAPPQTPPHLLAAARRLFRIDRLLALGPLFIGWRRD